MKLLVEHNSDINAKDNNGKTALHISLENKYFDIVKLLIEHNSDINAKDNFNRTALHIASTEEIKNYLKQHGARE